MVTWCLGFIWIFDAKHEVKKTLHNPKASNFKNASDSAVPKKGKIKFWTSIRQKALYPGP